MHKTMNLFMFDIDMYNWLIFVILSFLNAYIFVSTVIKGSMICFLLFPGL